MDDRRTLPLFVNLPGGHLERLLVDPDCAELWITGRLEETTFVLSVANTPPDDPARVTIHHHVDANGDPL
jgi:hypothetical protein